MRKDVVLALFLGVACAHTEPGDDSPDARRNDARVTPDDDAPKPDAAPVPDSPPIADARPGIDSSTPPVDAPPMSCGTPGPDTCAAAMDLTGPATSGGATLTANTTGLADDLAPAAIDCTGFEPDGPDAIYRVNVGAGKTIQASVRPMSGNWDLSIYIASSCASTACEAGSDVYLNEATAETVSYVTPAAGMYYIVVDGWATTAFGCYQLTVTVL